MKILVTGSSGFIGYHLVKKLLNDGHEVVGVDNHNDYYDPSLKIYRRDKLLNKNFKFYLQDINDLKIDESDFELAIHLAAQAGVRVKKSKHYLYKHSNINGFQEFCKFCKNLKINKIIYASSSSVYSDNHTQKFIEGVTNLAPKSEYGLSKLANEQYASEFSEKTKISFIGLRFFSVYGPLGRPDMAYYLFTEALKNKKNIMLNNKGKMARDMTYIDDIVDGICSAMNYFCSSGVKIKNEIFNLGNNHPVSTRTLLDSIELKLGRKSIVRNTQTLNEAISTHADITKAKNLLGYEPKIKLSEGINKFLRWHRNYENL